MKFSKRYFIIPILLIVFVFLFYSVYEDVKNKTIEKFNTEQLILAKSASLGIKSFFSQYHSELRFLSQLPSINTFKQEGEILMSQFFKSHSDQIEAITRMDPSGKILYTFPYSESAIGRDISYQKHVQQVIQTKKPVVSDVFMAVQGYLAIAFHVPILDKNEFKGSLGILIAIDKLGQQYVRDIKIGKTGYAFVLSENNLEIYCPNKEHISKSIIDIAPDSNSVNELIKSVKDKSEGFVVCAHEGEIQSASNEKHVVFYRVPLFNTYWTILTSVPEDEILDTIVSFRNRLILIFISGFLVLAFYFFSFAKVRTIIKEESKRKSVEKALRQSEHEFRILFEEFPIGIGIANLNGKLLAHNKAMRSQGNYTEDDIKKINHVVELYYDPKQREEILDKFQKYGTVTNHPVLFKRKDGPPYHALISLNKATFKGEPCLHALIEDITERRKAEIALQESELKLRNIFEHSTNLFYSHDSNHVLHYFSPQVKDILGYEVEEALIKWTELASDNPINQIGFEKTVKAIETGIEQEPYELELVHKDGHKVLVEVREAPLVENGKTIAMVGSLTDITERKRIEGILIESEKKFRQVVEEAVEVIFTTDTNGYFTYANPAAIKLTGFTLDEIKKLRYLDLIEPEFKRRVAVHYTKQLKEQIELTNFEYPFRTKAGELKWINQNARLIIEDHEVKGFYVIARDVTERHRLESARQEAERRFSTLMSNLPGLAYRCANDKDWTMEFVSHGCLELTGFKPSDLINNSVISFNELILEEDQERLWNKWQNVLREKEIFQDEYRIRTKNGEIKWVWEQGCGIYSGDQVIALEGFIIDVTERKRMLDQIVAEKEKAEESSRLKSGFLSAMSHEIRTPLNTIIGYNGVIRELFEESGNPEHKGFFEAVENGSLRLLNTITQILDTSRIEANEFNVELISMSMNSSVESAFRQVKILGDKKNLEMKLYMPAKDIKVIADDYCLNGVLMNILGNAIKYTERGKIEVKLVSDEEFAVCTVKDEGIGMSEKYQKHLYQPFSQEEIGISRRFEGTGLGLALTKSYIDSMNGKISVESKKDVGTTVTIKILLDK